MAEEKTMDVEELQKKLEAAEKKLKAAEKKAADKAPSNKDADKAERSVKAILDAEERVRVHLFKDNERYKDDLVVGINGVMYQIQRGVDVEVPKSVYEVIMESQRQDEIAAQKMRELGAKTEDAALR